MNKKKTIIMSALLVVLVALVIGITYAVYTYTGNSNLNTIDLGRISMSYTEPSNAYVLNNALPMSDDEGRGQNEYFEFTVTTHATTKESDSVGITIPYEINISDIAIDEGMNALSKSLIKVNLVKVDGMAENEVVVPTLISGLSASNLNTGASIVYQTSDTHKNGNTTITSKYRLRAWITTGFDASNADETYQYKFRVNVNSNMDALEGNNTETPKLLRTAILEQGIVTTGDGLYVSTETNDGSPTYYYHGNVENNYVKLEGLTKSECRYNNLFITNPINNATPTEEECKAITHLCDATSMGGMYASGVSQEECTQLGELYGKEFIYIEATPTWETYEILWRVIRKNEDNTIRIIMSNTHVEYVKADLSIAYYTDKNFEGGAMKVLNDWYSTNLIDYDDEIVTSTFCEQAKVTGKDGKTIDNAEMTYYENYSSDFRCATDGNGHGLITNQKIGLTTIDELMHAGLEFGDMNENGNIPEHEANYLSNIITQTMSLSWGINHNEYYVWLAYLNNISGTRSVYTNYLSPVINLNSNVLVTGNGTSTSPWVVTK